MARRQISYVVVGVIMLMGIGVALSTMWWGSSDPDRSRQQVVRDPELKRLIKAHQTPILLARYRTTLRHRLPREGRNIEVASGLLAGTLIQPGETFAQNERLGPYTSEKGYVSGPAYADGQIVQTEGGGVCQIATTLFNAVVLSDLEIQSRRPHSMTVPYVPPGQDATVSGSTVDFVFRNSSEDPILIWSRIVGDLEWLEISFYSRHEAPEVKWHHETSNRVSYAKQAVVDSSLTPGEERVEQPGHDGVTVKSWVHVDYPDGTSRKRDFGVHQYEPTPEITRKGPKKRDAGERGISSKRHLRPATPAATDGSTAANQKLPPVLMPGITC